MMCRSPDATYQVSWKSADWFRGQEKSFEGFYHIEACQPINQHIIDCSNKVGLCKYFTSRH